MATQPSDAQVAVFESPELFEMILMHLDTADILKARGVSTHFRTVIESSLKPMRRLFLKPELDKGVWLFDDTGPRAESLAERNLRRHFAPSAAFVDATTIGSEVEMRHLGLRARVVQLNPWLLEGDKKSIWQSCYLRSSGTKKDHVRALALNTSLHGAPLRHQLWSSLGMRLRRYHRRRFETRVRHMLGTTGWQRWTVLENASPEFRRTDDLDGVSKRMLLTQPPVRKVTVRIRFQQTGPSEGGEVLSKHKDIVKEIVVSSGVRLVHLLAAMTDKDKIAIREAESVTTTLLLHDVVEIVEPLTPMHFVRRVQERGRRRIVPSATDEGNAPPSSA